MHLVLVGPGAAQDAHELAGGMIDAIAPMEIEAEAVEAGMDGL